MTEDMAKRKRCYGKEGSFEFLEKQKILCLIGGFCSCQYPFCAYFHHESAIGKNSSHESFADLILTPLIAPSIVPIVIN
jgi:hypothetical protein